MNICRSQNGHVKLWHRIENSDISRDKNTFFVFVKMLLMAHYEDDFSSIRFRGEQYKLKAGEFSASMAELTNYMNLDKSTCRRVIKKLKNDKRIETKTDRQTTVFSICNWSQYQSDSRVKKANERANERTNDRANEWTNDRANVTGGKKKIKKIKKIKKEKEYTSSSDEHDRAEQIKKAHAWICELFNKNPNKFKLSDKRRTHLKARLRDIGADGIRRAYHNITASPFHRGDNDRGWSVDTDPYWLLANYERTEKWRDTGGDVGIDGKPNIDLSKVEMEEV